MKKSWRLIARRPVEAGEGSFSPLPAKIKNISEKL
jgi:hypothetical protein